jgi:hypothetical protein
LSIGRKRNAAATPVAKTIAVNASIASFVLISRSHINKIPRTTKGKAPKEMLKP